ncbi:class I SAM-dependent methyltransferase [Arthrobacter tumbae]
MLGHISLMSMSQTVDYDAYASKMRRLALAGTDLEVDARFLDMLAPRGSRILDIGCGIGSAVNALRQRGHEAYGVDPTNAVLDVAGELFEESWYRTLPVEEISSPVLLSERLPAQYEAILMSGNVPAFLAKDALRDAFLEVSRLLVAGGLFVVGTTSGVRGGPHDQDSAAASANLPLIHRFSDWHLGPFTTGSSWSVSVFAKPGVMETGTGPNGIFTLNG